jgi:hypothetical protein
MNWIIKLKTVEKLSVELNCLQGFLVTWMTDTRQAELERLWVLVNARLGVAGKLSTVGAGVGWETWFWQAPKGRTLEWKEKKSDVKKIQRTCNS